MISLYLLTAHLMGDFVIQTDRMAAEKLHSRSVRAFHVATYSVPFLPLLSLTSTTGSLVFVLSNGVLHYAIDTRRWAEPKDELESYPIIIDQIMHLTVLTILGIGVYGI